MKTNNTTPLPALRETIELLPNVELAICFEPVIAYLKISLAHKDMPTVIKLAEEVSKRLCNGREMRQLKVKHKCEKCGEKTYHQVRVLDRWATWCGCPN